MNKPRKHSRETESLARQLQPADIYEWLVTVGYFPESYVLPPCFHVVSHPPFGTYFAQRTGRRFAPSISQVCEVHFPKSDLADRTFGILDPALYSDIATEVANGWGLLLDVIFNSAKRVYSYSFPIPLSKQTPGAIGGLRAGRMIYEWIEMAEEDLVEEAYAYKYLVRTDVKNCYPSIYTHSIAWAVHTRSTIRSGGNRNNYTLLGNRLDKLFQSANDGCTNGLPVGPAVSDLIAELILSAVDILISPALRQTGVLALRFKDDYGGVGGKRKKDIEPPAGSNVCRRGQLLIYGLYRLWTCKCRYPSQENNDRRRRNRAPAVPLRQHNPSSQKQQSAQFLRGHPEK